MKNVSVSRYCRHNYLELLQYQKRQVKEQEECKEKESDNKWIIFMKNQQQFKKKVVQFF